MSCRTASLRIHLALRFLMGTFSSMFRSSAASPDSCAALDGSSELGEALSRMDMSIAYIAVDNSIVSISSVRLNGTYHI
ncbi:uncharacterized protein F5147DRAFT_734195 [Suillus discolor]|uniref:Secreted protein n=1 Tax=Suillus discolor TaxID=1912936 RepID=A0A9P7EQA0_9AGAM|nr:uncharacterized protein F5147DRAFT_734195 [Suillus discolor]KAG2082758.1 hypothetical protein F5147DRAFT_734195 [Suillus discolor]